jgi:hypothetical protein
MRRFLAAIVVPLGFVACGGPGAHLQKRHAASGKGSSSASVTASPSASEDGVTVAKDPDRATRWAWSAIGCWVGAAWAEALGAQGEERLLSTLRRCRLVATDVLGAKADDELTLRGVRAIEPGMVDRVATRIEKTGGGELVALVRATADAAREALAARKAAEDVRNGGAVTDALGAKGALAQLWSRKDQASHAVALLLAADHVESARTLDGKAKAIAAAPAFEVVFGVPRQDAWIPYASAVAKAGGHPPEKDDERSVLMALIAAFADKFEQVGRALDPGEAKEASWGSARRLRAELEAAKTKDKPLGK